MFVLSCVTRDGLLVGRGKGKAAGLAGSEDGNVQMFQIRGKREQAVENILLSTYEGDMNHEREL